MDIGKFIAKCYGLGIRLLNKKPKETLTKEEEQCDEVHHKIPLTPENIYNPEITLNWDNLELLCSSCHSIEHNKKRVENHKNYRVQTLKASKINGFKGYWKLVKYAFSRFLFMMGNKKWLNINNHSPLGIKLAWPV